MEAAVVGGGRAAAAAAAVAAAPLGVGAADGGDPPPFAESMAVSAVFASALTPPPLCLTWKVDAAGDG